MEFKFTVKYPYASIIYRVSLVDPNGKPFEEMEIEERTGYVPVAHLQEYGICFEREVAQERYGPTSHPHRFAAQITINGENFPLCVLPDATGKVILKTKPGEDNGKLFQALGLNKNEQARTIAAANAPEDDALITITLIPEKAFQPSQFNTLGMFGGGGLTRGGSFGGDRGLSRGSSHSFGGAVSGYSKNLSGQTFGTTSFDPDNGSAQTQSLRLVIDTNAKRVMAPKAETTVSPPPALGRG